ncbi:hypothetical protein A1O3_03873 [Capronia epimyces CBS 606.96]|uniref:Uncharacterized protein n=1 Tax=Capronia epimyces CBS 606.96 TaxID=1182542 RepID=W9YXB0_9EURO|nr:uncharacterized protein A1O3_03873 [Capronia epimyces CBS 606.96]EXJ86919.1 hypothetical protein A1O3_03873 [Capronia epimyces CBS 606.96]
MNLDLDLHTINIAPSTSSVSAVPNEKDISAPGTYTLDAAPGTDIYASPLPPVRYVFSAPIVSRRILKAAFRSAKVGVRARWSLQFDQGGLVFIVPDPATNIVSTLNANANASTCTNTGTAQTQDLDPYSSPASSWVKAGIEVNDGKPYVSVVTKSRDGWCDWSLVPMPISVSSTAGGMSSSSSSSSQITLRMTRSKNALMIWMINDNDEATLIRKVPWVFLDLELDNHNHHHRQHESTSTHEAEAEAEVMVGIYAARPDPDNEATGNLAVSFQGFSVDVDVDGCHL